MLMIFIEVNLCADFVDKASGELKDPVVKIKPQTPCSVYSRNVFPSKGGTGRERKKFLLLEANIGFGDLEPCSLWRIDLTRP